ncbi:MAG: hypothetical protein ACR2OH_13110 [Microthrixaceae bacterium]
MLEAEGLWLDKVKEPSSGSDPRRSPAYANAYAVSYRLLGQRDMATELSSTVAARFGGRESDPPSTWLPGVVSDATEAALALGTEFPDELAAAEQASAREALRRRLSGADSTTWVAVGLHHLGGYPLDRTAAVMDTDQSTVEELCGPYAPPPGVTWASLGDPLTREAGRVRRSGAQRNRFPIYPVLAGVIVVALVIWAATSVGERPSVGNADAGTDPEGTQTDAGTGDPVVEPGGALFEATLNPVPSAGCESPAPTSNGSPVTPGTAAAAEVDIRGVPFSYRVFVPESDQPAPLVMSLTDESVDPATFQNETKLEEALPGSIHITAPSLVAGIPPVGSEVVPALLDDAIGALCVDLGRVFTVGHGRGAPEATQAVCTAPELIVGAAAVAAAPQPPEDCVLDPHSAIWVSARDDDPTVDTGDALAEVGGYWAALVSAEQVVVDGMDERTIVRRWAGPGNVSVTTRSQTEGGHAWNSLDTSAVVEFVAETARRLG